MSFDYSHVINVSKGTCLNEPYRVRILTHYSKIQREATIPLEKYILNVKSITCASIADQEAQAYSDSKEVPFLAKVIGIFHKA